VLFDAIFLTLFFATWLLLGSLPWVVISVRRRAYGALFALPFALLGGAAGGVIVPAAGLDNSLGVGISMLGAFLGGGVLTWTAYRAWDDYDIGRHFARWGRPSVSPRSSAPRRNDLSDAGEQAGTPVDSQGPPPDESQTP
jgi:4-amino-4-deoxy-L-arabinose transferase-like glycosyltransferase